MTPENKIIFNKRFRSFLWRLGGIIAVAILNLIADTIGLFDLAPSAVVVVGLIVGEITKYVNTNRKPKPIE